MLYSCTHIHMKYTKPSTRTGKLAVSPFAATSPSAQQYTTVLVPPDDRLVHARVTTSDLRSHDHASTARSRADPFPPLQHVFGLELVHVPPLFAPKPPRPPPFGQQCDPARYIRGKRGNRVVHVIAPHARQTQLDRS